MVTMERPIAAEDMIAIAKDIAKSFDDKLADQDAEAALEIPGVRAGIEQYVLGYVGRFAFMTDLNAKARRFGFAKWSIGLYRGVLNVLRAEALREEADAEQGEVARVVPNGIYTAVFADQTYRTVRVKAHWDKAEGAKGTQVLQYLNGPDNRRDYVSAGFVRGADLQVWRKIGDATAEALQQAWAAIIGDVRTAGEAYALASGNCFRCNRLLTVPASLHRGLGPECVKKFLQGA